MSVTPDEIPKKVGRYIIEESVGFGAMGAVYKARDPLISRTVAIKTIRLDVPPDSPHYQSFLKRFYTEAKVSGTLSHPNIVTLYDIGETENKIPFLAMEYVDGETVAEMLEGGERLTPEQVVALVSQMASAIDYAHTKGVIHRDIKPSNIIVYDGEKVKITDFGIAKLMDTEGTQTASLLGTPSYMSPEQAMGEKLDGRTDIFSLGVVAFEMLSGEQPFPGNNVTSILYKLVHADPVRPSNLEVLGLLPSKWHQVFSKVLAKTPVDRYQTAAEFVSDLEQCLGSWFGALEGETVMMTSSEATTVLEQVAGTESSPPAAGEAEAEEETVVLEPSELPHAAGETEQHQEPEEEETLVLSPADGEPDTQTAELPADLTPPEKMETVTMEADSARTVEPTAFLPPSSSGETVALAPPPSATAEAPVETTERLLPTGERRWNKKQLAVGASAAGALLMLVVVIVLAVRGGREVVTPLPPEAPPPPPTPVTGTLAIVTEPEGAAVWINGEDSGVTPYKRADMGLGTYTVRLEKKGFKTQELTAELLEDSPDVRLDVALEAVPVSRPRPAARAYVRVESTPGEAQVLLDGQPVGTTPIKRLRARPGKRTLLLRKEGFESWQKTLELKAGETETVSATLDPVVPEEPEPAEPVVQVKVGELVERGPDVVDPKCIECPNPPYPPAARKARLQGVVELSFIVTETGVVQDVRVEESGGDVFDGPVVEVVKQWRFEPATKQGVPVKVRLRRRFRYQRGR